MLCPSGAGCQEYSEGSIGTTTAILGCNLTLQQSPGNGSWMVQRDCSVTQLLAPTAFQEAAFIHLSLPWVSPQGKTRNGNSSTSTENNFFWQFAPWLEFPQMFCFHSWWFLGLKYMWVSLGPCIGCGPALVPMNSKSHMNCSRNSLVLWLTAWKYSSQHSLAFQNWMWSTASLQYFVGLDGQIICEEAK